MRHRSSSFNLLGIYIVMVMHLLSLVLLLLINPSTTSAELLSWSEPGTIVIGATPSPGVGWMEGVCYVPITNVIVGDTLQFNFDAHNLYKMSTKEHFDACNFENATLLVQVGQGQQFNYIITEQDAATASIYFACQLGSHCNGGNQKLHVDILVLNNTSSPSNNSTSSTSRFVESRYIVGASQTDCTALQNGNNASSILVNQSSSAADDNVGDSVMGSECSDPILQDDGTFYVSCLSGPNTLTPGGVINQARILHWPYPKNRRVKAGLRTWEFVADDPSAAGVVVPVPINQLYVHHLSGRVILGQGTEGIRQSKPDAPFPHPYGVITGDEGDMMVFHIIDLRQVDDWLACIECRCKDGNGTYLDGASNTNQEAVTVTGGVDCCTNCTELAGPTVDYRMRYNVSYSEITEDNPTLEILMLTADISPAVDKNIEFDVPQYESLPLTQIDPNRPFIQHLVREAPFNQLLKHDFFGDAYHGPDPVKLFRCVGHLHVAAVGMRLEDATTNETLCQGIGRYGTDPATDQGILNAISVDSFDTPKTFPANLPVRLISEYDATDFHTGVMGMWFLFISGEKQVTGSEADLIVKVCTNPTCDLSLLPSVSDINNTEAEPCVDALADSPICLFGNLCECEEFINAPESSGCNGVYPSSMGDVPVNSMCAKSCGCPSPSVTAGATEGGCENTLSNHPLCTFGNLCKCDVLVASPDSTGCGGVYTSQMGDVQIDEVCAEHCNACPAMSPDNENEVLEQALVDQIETDLSKECHYATERCRLLLSNLYSCADVLEKDKSTEMNGMIEDQGTTAVNQQLMVSSSESALLENVILKHGRHLALQYSKLGDPSLHTETAQDAVILPCPVVDNTEDSTAATSTAGISSAFWGEQLFYTLVALAITLQLWA